MTSQQSRRISAARAESPAATLGTESLGWAQQSASGCGTQSPQFARPKMAAETIVWIYPLRTKNASAGYETAGEMLLPGIHVVSEDDQLVLTTLVLDEVERLLHITHHDPRSHRNDIDDEIGQFLLKETDK